MSVHPVPNLRQIQEALRRQREAYAQVRELRWREIRDFDWDRDYPQVLELLELAHRLGGPPRKESGLQQWYAAILGGRRDA